MARYRVEESASPIKNGHRDYEQNLKEAEMLCERTKKHLLNGMNVKISDSEHLKKALLIISWKPGFTEKMGNYASPVFLHQSNNDFKKESTSVINFYMKTVREHQAKSPEQPDFFKEGCLKA